MSEEHVLKHIDPFRWAERGSVIEVDIALSYLTRLSCYLLDTSGKISVRIVFDKDEQKRCYFQGHCEGKLLLQCQRCMQGIDYALDARFKLFPVVSEKPTTDNLELAEETILTPDKQLVLLNVIEDELILALPLVAKHDAGACPVEVTLRAGEPIADDEKPSNPFELLKNLKKESQD